MKGGETFPRDEIKELHWEPIQQHSAFLCADLSRTHQPHLVPVHRARCCRTQSLSGRERRTLLAGARGHPCSPSQPSRSQHTGAAHLTPTSCAGSDPCALTAAAILWDLQPTAGTALAGNIPVPDASLSRLFSYLLLKVYKFSANP